MPTPHHTTHGPTLFGNLTQVAFPASAPSADNWFMKRRRLDRALRLATAAVAAMLVAGLTVPASPPPSDWLLTLQARNALLEAKGFAKLNVGLTVRDGIVVLHGTVPSAAQIDGAEKAVRAVPGVREVVNELYVPPIDPLVKNAPRPSDSQRPTVSLGPPVKVETVKPFVPPPVVAAPPPPTLAEHIDQLRTGDRRFRDIRFEVQGGKVTLRGSVGKAQDAWDFAREVGRLPGVTGVSQNVATGQ